MVMMLSAHNPFKYSLRGIFRLPQKRPPTHLQRNMLNGGLLSQFLAPIEGTKRYYRLKVTYTDNITESDEVVGSNLRYIKDEGNVEIFNFVLEYSSASGDWINQRISDRFIYDGIDVTRMEFRSGVSGKYLHIYGIWIIAEDVIE